MRKVDFLIVGVQKGGTTALDFYLRQHPNISMAKQKEVHYFDNDSNFDEIPNYDSYHQYFENNDKIKGEATPIYIYWNMAIKRIWEYNPKIKIIVILRNPIERAYSHWNMERSRNADNLPFYKAIINENKRYKEVLPERHRVYSYIDRGFYSEQLRNIYRYFDNSQVMVVKNEDLKNNPLNLLNQVCNFLGVAQFESIDRQNIHSKEYENPIDIESFEYLRDIFVLEIEMASKMLGWDCTNWLKIPNAKKVLFYRDFQSYTGGHQKVFDYFEHFKSNKNYKVDIVFSLNTIWREDNPWNNLYANTNTLWNPKDYDIIFVAGMDWGMIPQGLEESKIIINLIQGYRHSDKTDPRYQSLKRKAIRICVSKEVAMSIEATGEVDGAIYTIPNGHKLEEIEHQKEYDIYILGLKNPTFAQKLYKQLVNQGFSVKLSKSKIPRDEVFENMAQSYISIALPNPNEGEGFYLPALEAMKYSDITIVPDCVGNRSFCYDNQNCLMPLYNIDSIIQRVYQAKEIMQNPIALQRFKSNTIETLEKHSIEIERKRFYTILKRIDGV